MGTRLACLLALAFLTQACSESPPTGPGEDGGASATDAYVPPGSDGGLRVDAFVPPGTDGGPRADSGLPDDFPTFETDIVPILERSCGSSTVGCHDRAAYSPMMDTGCRGWLSLVDAPLGGGGCDPRDLYTRLRELDAWQCEAFDPRARYVVPCDPSGSYLYRKIAGGAYCRDGDGNVTQPMPMGTTLPSADVLLVQEWIMAGAPRDGEARTDCTVPPVGSPPVASIFHPGAGEMRRVGMAVPMIGEGTDTEDGMLPASALVWTSDVEGELGRGRRFDWTPSTLGAQTITLTARDSDGRVDTDEISLTIIP